MGDDPNSGTERPRLVPRELLTEVLTEEGVEDQLRDELIGLVSMSAGEQRTEAIRAAVEEAADG